MAQLNEYSCRPGARLRNLFTAWEARAVKHFINSFKVVTWNGAEPRIDRSDPYGEYTIYIPRTGTGVNYRKYAFGYSLSTVEGETEEDPSTTICTIQPGAIRMHGAGVYYLAAAAEVTLDPMSEPWVYASCPRGGGSVSIAASSTEPISNVSTLKIPLYQFERTTGGSYVLPDGGIRHIGDVNLDTPLL